MAYHIPCHVDSIGVDLFNAFLWIPVHHALKENLQVVCAVITPNDGLMSMPHIKPCIEDSQSSVWEEARKPGLMAIMDPQLFSRLNFLIGFGSKFGNDD